MRQFETKQDRQRRIKRQKRSSAVAMITAIAVVAVLSIVVATGKRSLDQQNQENASRVQELTAQIAEQESRSAALEDYKKYVKTKKYIEEIAKEKFGLLYPDEIILKPSTGN